MENASKREKFLFWLIKNSYKWWLWAFVIVAASILLNSGPFLAGLGMVLYGVLAFAAGINLALERTLGKDYASKGLWIKDKAKEKKNDTTH